MFKKRILQWNANIQLAEEEEEEWEGEEEEHLAVCDNYF